eukprot:3015789-Pleurochrysis_carterae.AAC.1
MHARPVSACQLGPASSASCAGDGPRREATDAWAACLAGATAQPASCTVADAYEGDAPRALRAARDASAFAQCVGGGLE